MNKEYGYRENDVLVNTDEGIETREYVDNFDNILKVENNIENLENKIKLYECDLGRKIILRKDSKSSFNIVAGIGMGVGILIAIIGIANGSVIPSLNVSLKIIGAAIGLGSLVSVCTADEDVRKKTIEKLKSKISVAKYELEQEKQDLDILKKESKKIEIPKDNEIKMVPNDYVIRNLKHKLSIVEMFKVNTERFVAIYQSGNKYDILDELYNKYHDRYTAFDFELIEFLISEYQKKQIEKQKVKGKTKSKSKR